MIKFIALYMTQEAGTLQLAGIEKDWREDEYIEERISWINPEYIVSITESSYPGRVNLETIGREFQVRGTLEEILSQIPNPTAGVDEAVIGNGKI